MPDAEVVEALNEVAMLANCYSAELPRDAERLWDAVNTLRAHILGEHDGMYPIHIEQDEELRLRDEEEVEWNALADYFGRDAVPGSDYSKYGEVFFRLYRRRFPTRGRDNESQVQPKPEGEHDDE